MSVLKLTLCTELHHPTAKNAPLLLDKIAHPSQTSSRNALVKEQKAERKKKGSRGKGVRINV